MCLVPHSYPPLSAPSAFTQSSVLQASQRRESMSTLRVVVLLRRSLHRCEGEGLIRQAEKRNERRLVDVILDRVEAMRPYDGEKFVFRKCRLSMSRGERAICGFEMGLMG